MRQPAQDFLTDAEMDRMAAAIDIIAHAVATRPGAR